LIEIAERPAEPFGWSATRFGETDSEAMGNNGVLVRRRTARRAPQLFFEGDDCGVMVVSHG